ncbi:AAA family ATPase [Silvanigrella paludirubra]|uniref:AAA family ATPase n=1 Tax=Silvanigrella paludirubra TaxID=2499159 RepID=A0A6N6VSQ7_9BACT|nr:UvrD-helicase domain-containing protein [Silvanigrella paludirubra]KAB8039157.1 AAA family ATPase [Silvanigrella paludirubra]
MQATLEQVKVLEFTKNSQDDFKISAFAGAGKTSTLRMLAKEFNKLSFLYLAFNKDIKKEAEESFTRNVYCTTYHALARRAMQIDNSNYKNKLNLKLKTSEIVKILKVDQQDFCNPYSVLPIIKKTLANFKISSSFDFHESHIDLESIIELTGVPTEQSRIATFVYKMAKKYWQYETDCEKEFPMDHDTYLKMWHLADPKIDVDAIFFDEAQDANAVILDIVRMQNCRKIFVGDTHQKIYSWRGAVNAMESLKIPELSLTQSFRFGVNIAKFANIILKKKGEKRELLGFDKIQSKLGSIDETKKFTHLCRTNAELVMQAIFYASQNKKIYLMGTEAELFNRCKQAYLLFANKKDLLPINCEFKTYKSWNDFVAIAKGNRENNILVKVVLKFQEQLPQRIDEIKKYLANEKDANVILCSAHKSKGLQWEQVRIGSDFSFKIEEEQNLFYVASTRAIEVLDISNCENILKEII